MAIFHPIFGHKDGDMVIYPCMGELGIISPANEIKRWIYPTSLGFSHTFGSLKQPISLGSAPWTETDIFKAPKNRLFLTVYSRCPQFHQNPIAKLRKLSKKELHIALLHGNRMNPSTKRSPQIEIFDKCACLTQNKRPQKGEHAQGWKV